MPLSLTCTFPNEDHSPQVFKNLHLGANTTSLLATGIAGIFEFVFTIPAVLWVDNLGRRTILITGGVGMAVCHFIVAGIIGSYSGNFESNPSAGWAAVAFVWIFIINFAYSWGECFNPLPASLRGCHGHSHIAILGPVSWIVVSEVFPLSMRAKGVSIGGSSNWVSIGLFLAFGSGLIIHS